MKLFLDTAVIEEIRALVPTGLIDGVTTNPSLILKAGQNPGQVIKEICSIVQGPISAQVLATETKQMIEQGRQLASIAPNVVVKLPMTLSAMTACRVLSQENIAVNVTLIFSLNQAIIAAKSGATFVSPFIGRLDDIGEDGIQLIKDIRTTFDCYKFQTQILAASIRHTDHLKAVALAGSDVATVPTQVLEDAFLHQLTTKGLEKFLSDAHSLKSSQY